MPTKILVLTHRNFSHLFYEVMDIMKLPIKLKVEEVGFGEINKYIDSNKLLNYDLVITSGAHLEVIKRDFNELTYSIPIYPFQFSESDLVKSIAKAKKYSNKIVLMYYGQNKYELKKYEKLLDVKLDDLSFEDLDDAEKSLREYKKMGFNVVIGTSSICELAEDIGLDNILIYSTELIKIELMKAYQLATTYNKVVKHSKLKEIMFKQMSDPVFLLDASGMVLDVNRTGVGYSQKNFKHEIIGKNIDSLLGKTIYDLQNENKEDETDEVLHPLYINSKINCYLLIKKNSAISPVIKEFKDSYTSKNKSKYSFEDIIHQSTIMKKLITRTKQYSRSDAPILIYGESGTGKELFAHSIHNNSQRKDKPFLPVNCSAIPQSILESELFGYEEGAFTGAKKGGKPGMFEIAQNGTIFLDEISEIPLDIQTKLLRVLQEKEVIRLGGKKIIPLDVRIITATNKLLIKQVEEGSFREDLYYRINVLQLNVPSLRERSQDIPLIFKYLLQKNGLSPEQAIYLSEFGHESIVSYQWQGNIREIENFVVRLTALTSLSTTTYDLANCFTDVFLEFLQSKRQDQQVSIVDELKISDSLQRSASERKKIIDALKQAQSNKLEAAKILGISRTTLWRRMNEFNLDLILYD
ncbi:sigma 54-interacting transcriptional regulator [Virgibacillus litoralis]|uniref:Propionate catabolism operon transcriptional regulator n=1 Tax=Virgibacillus litoralis TaxID=578221 RepID=A0ABS4H8M6_9BACI|nr:sigma 54-interacting transcriptional regulator [Virgibacillus litoralis]MBP1947089.1 propionate catabolism operon transcriptional regulator [Virgibacillus litoralis]